MGFFIEMGIGFDFGELELYSVGMENIQAYVFTVDGKIMYSDCQQGKGLVHAIDFAIAENYAYERGAQILELNNTNAPDVMEKAVEEGCDGLIFVGPEGIGWMPFDMVDEDGKIPVVE